MHRFSDSPGFSLWQFLPELLRFRKQEVAADVGKRAVNLLLLMHLDSSGIVPESVSEVP